jgi:hypothetical protein
VLEHVIVRHDMLPMEAFHCGRLLIGGANTFGMMISIILTTIIVPMVLGTATRRIIILKIEGPGVTGVMEQPFKDVPHDQSKIRSRQRTREEQESKG